MMCDSLTRKWRALSFLERQGFFACVRAARGEWPDANSTPDGLCLDLLESFALTACGNQTAAVFAGVVRGDRGAVETLLSQQMQWYTNLYERDHLHARLAVEEMPDEDELAEIVGHFCDWFGR